MASIKLVGNGLYFIQKPDTVALLPYHSIVQHGHKLCFHGIATLSLNRGVHGLEVPLDFLHPVQYVATFFSHRVTFRQLVLVAGRSTSSLMVDSTRFPYRNHVCRVFELLCNILPESTNSLHKLLWIQSLMVAFKNMPINLVSGCLKSNQVWVWAPLPPTVTPALIFSTTAPIMPLVSATGVASHATAMTPTVLHWFVFHP